MAGRAPRNNLMAGAFLLISLVLGVAITLWVGGAKDRLMTQRTTYVFRFKLIEGAMGLKKDSMIKVGGQPAGMVDTVGFTPPDGAMFTAAAGTPTAETKKPYPPAYVYVTAKIRSDLLLYRNAKVYLELPLLGSVSTINIPDIGGGKAADGTAIAPLAAMEVVDAGLSPPAFLAQAGYGEEQKTQMQNMLKRGSEIGDSIAGITDDAKFIVSDARARWPEWSVWISDTFRNLRDATGAANDRISDARRLLASVQDVLDKNRPFLDAIFFNTSQLTEKLNTDLYRRITGLMDDAQAAMKDAVAITDRTKDLIIEEGPSVRRMLADLRLSADQLKLAMIEIRRNPWRLLYQPKRKELAEELLYDTARQYADAVSDLRAASDSLQGMLAAQQAGTAATGPDAARIAELTAQVKAAFDRYKAQEQKFMDLVIKGAE